MTSQRFTAAFLLLAVVLLPGSAQAAGSAYAVDPADVNEPGNCKVESWVSFGSNSDFIATANPSCVFDLGHPVEFDLQIQRTRSDGDWGTSIAPKFKTNIVPTAVGRFGFSIEGGAMFDLITKENTGFFALVPATLRFNDVVRLNLNAGWLWDRIADRHFFTYGAGMDWRTPDNVWTLTVEVFGQMGTFDSKPEADPRWQVGLRWRPIERFSVDLVYGRNITGENANWLTLATAIRFPPDEK
jgi:hypothetical protein